MFIKRTYSKNYTYLSIVQTYREQGRVKHKTLLQLGREDELRAEGALEGLAASMARVTGVAAAQDGDIRVGELQEQSRHNWGAIKAYRALWNLFGLDEILTRACRSKRRKFDLLGVVFATVVMRLMSPCSKLKVYERQHEYLGLPEISLDHLYRAMDYLAAGKEEIELELFERQRDLFNMRIDVVLYDVTTLYFESVAQDGLREFGFGKDGKFNEVQVVVGLLVDTEGRPVGFDVFPGNTFEGRTLIAAVRKLSQRFQIRQVVIVADRGINNKLNLLEIKRAGFEYIVGSRLKSLAGVVQKDVLERGKYETVKQNENGEVELACRSLEFQNKVRAEKADGSVKDTVVLSEQLLCTWSRERAHKDRADRERLVERAKELLTTPSKLRVRRGARRFINGADTDKPILDEEQVREDAKWDGFYGIQSSRRDASPKFILDAYHLLWRIEESFRIMKHTLQARPIFHRKPRRIKGHLVMCFLAFLLERTLELRLKPQTPEVAPEKIREALSSLEVSVVEAQGQKLYLTSKVTGLANTLLRALNLAAPKPISGAPPV